MYITKIEIAGFIPFDTFGIKHITVSPKELVQIVAGSNGSGKSSLLKEASPLPGCKSLYHKDGYKVVTVIHNDHEYTAGSYFSKHAGLHSFKEDEVELNINHTSSQQLELCKQYLGYTELIHAFTHCEYKFCTMSAAERKKLLLSLSPATPDFLIEMHSQARYKLREAKANISMLQSRRQEIEAKLIDKKELLVLEKQKTAAEEEQRVLGNILFQVEEEYKKYHTAFLEYTTSPKMLDIEKLRKLKCDVQYLLTKMPAVTYRTENDITVAISVLENQNKEKQQALNDIGNIFQSVTQEIERLEKNLKRLEESAEQVKLKEYLQGIEQEFTLLAQVKDTYLIPEAEYAQYVQAAQAARKEFLYLQSFAGTDKPRWHTNRVIAKLNAFVKKYTQVAEGLSITIDELEQTISKNSLELQKLPTPPNKTLDTCHTCGYYTKFHEVATHLTNRIESDTKLLAKHKHAFTHWHRILSTAIPLLETWKQYYEIIFKVFTALTRNTYYKVAYPSLETFITHVNTKGIYLTLKEIDALITCQDKVRRYTKLKEEIALLKQKITIVQENNAPTKTILEELLHAKKTTRATLIGKGERLRETIQRILLDITQLQTLLTYNTTVTKIKDHVLRMTKYAELEGICHFFEDDYLPMLRKHKTTLDDKVYHITQTLKEQELLYARYEQEILSMLTKATQDKLTYEVAEYALSPECGMPKLNLINYANSLISNVNYVLSKVCSHKFCLKPLSVHDDFSCEFTTECNQSTNDKLTSLSNGEKSMMNFAWCISLLYVIKAQNYPVVFDECTDGLEPIHKQNFLTWFNEYVTGGCTTQLWLVDHDASMSNGFAARDVTCLNQENMVVPSDINAQTVLEKIA